MLGILFTTQDLAENSLGGSLEPGDRRRIFFSQDIFCTLLHDFNRGYFMQRVTTRGSASSIIFKHIEDDVMSIL